MRKFALATSIDPTYGRGVLITQREAARQLAAVGVSRTRARRVLSCGLAGEPVRTSGALLYDRDLVDALTSREHVDHEDLACACPEGIFVVRKDINVLETPEVQRANVGRCWPMAWWSVLLLADRIDRSGPAPLVATTCGFVVLGAEILRVDGDPGHEPTRRDPYAARLLLGEPGPWFEVFAERRLRTGSGRPWTYCRWTSAGLQPTSFVIPD